jgi:autophagy-related protein 16
MLKDEHQALGLAFCTMEDRYKQLQEDNTDLITRWMQVKAKDADKLNTENDDQLR